MTPDPGLDQNLLSSSLPGAFSRISGSESYSVLFVINLPGKEKFVKLEQLSVVFVEDC